MHVSERRGCGYGAGVGGSGRGRHKVVSAGEMLGDEMLWGVEDEDREILALMSRNARTLSELRGSMIETKVEMEIQSLMAEGV